MNYTFILLLISGITYAANSLQADMVTNIEQFIQSQKRQNSIPGMSVAIVRNQEVIYSNGFGLANKAQQKPAQADTVYNIGSITKLFTATAFMQLVEQGLIDLFTPIKEYLPAFGVSFAHRHGPITGWGLLTHYSGLAHDLPPKRGNAKESLAQAVMTLHRGQLKFAPETQFSYSNAGFVVAGRITEKMSGVPYDQYIHKNIFEPLAMNSAFFPNYGIPEDIRPLLAQGYHRGRPIAQLARRQMPAGGIFASVLDMSNFIKMIFNNGSLNGNQVLTPETLHEMLVIQNGFMSDAHKHKQGLGWVLNNPGIEGAGRVAWHNGATQGYSSDMILLLDQKLGVIVLTNVNSKDSRGAPGNIAKLVLNMLINR